MYTLQFIIVYLTLLALSYQASSPSYEEFYAAAQEFAEIITYERRYMHQRPELAFNEFETSEFIQAELKSMGVNYTTDWCFNPNRTSKGAGVVAQIGTGHPPCVGLRADIDALAVTEESDFSFKSMYDGFMHACGHDAHAAMLLGAARVLKKYEDQIPGTVRMVFQPAEEDGPGATWIVKEGFISDYPPVQSMFGMHVDAQSPTGEISTHPGASAAAADDFHITITGKGGHAAMHHMTIDPITAAAAIERGLYDIYSRELYFQTAYSGVISISYVKSTSSASNVIPDTVRMGGTIRSYSDDVMDFMRKRIKEVAFDVGNAYRCNVETEYTPEPYSVLYNDPELTEYFKTFAAHASKSGKIEAKTPRMGAEDFSAFGQGIPILFVNIGTGSGDEIPGHPPTNKGAHTPRFAIDERALPIGAAIHTFFAFEQLKKLAEK